MNKLEKWLKQGEELEKAAPLIFGNIANRPDLKPLELFYNDAHTRVAKQREVIEILVEGIKCFKKGVGAKREYGACGICKQCEALKRAEEIIKNE